MARRFEDKRRVKGVVFLSPLTIVYLQPPNIPNVSEEFQKTPKKANRWFVLAIVFALLYGITFSLYTIFNWIFFLASAYSFFMSYYLLPVQPSIFQGRPRSQQGRRGPAGNGDSTIQMPAAAQVVKRVMFTLVGLTLFTTVFFVVKGIVSSEDMQEQTELAPGETADVSEPTVVDLLSRGDDFFNNQQYDSAEVYYGKALEIEPANMEAVYGQGIVYWQTNRKDEAMTKFRTSYEGGNRFWWLSWVLADAFEKEGNPTQAIALYKEAIGMDSTNCSECYTRLAALEPENGARYLQLAAKHKSN
jgi:tetratricopeptide (TPR) repeat protein